MDTTNLAIRRNNEVMKKVLMVGVCAIVAVLLSMVIICPAFATSAAASSLRSIVTSLIDVIGLVFQVIGVILTVYAAAQMVLAFKNEDADSKTKSATLLAVGVILIFIKVIINGIGLVNMITG